MSNPFGQEKKGFGFWIFDFGFWHSLDVWALALEIKCLALLDLRLFKDKNSATGNPFTNSALSIVKWRNVNNFKLAFQ